MVTNLKTAGPVLQTIWDHDHRLKDISSEQKGNDEEKSKKEERKFREIECVGVFAAPIFCEEEALMRTAWSGRTCRGRYKRTGRGWSVGGWERHGGRMVGGPRGTCLGTNKEVFARRFSPSSERSDS